jgi:hypothetical protein
LTAEVAIDTPLGHGSAAIDLVQGANDVVVHVLRRELACDLLERLFLAPARAVLDPASTASA